MGSTKREISDVQAAPSDLDGKGGRRFNFWGVLASATVGAVLVVSAAYYFAAQDHVSVQTVAQGASDPMGGGVIPATESEAAARAEIRSAEQVTGMTAPADIAEDSAASAANNASAVPVPAAQAGVAHFYFAEGAADLPDDTADSLGNMVQELQEGETVSVTGLQQNPQSDELVKERVSAVRGALLQAGVPADRIRVLPPKAAAQETYQVEVVLH